MAADANSSNPAKTVHVTVDNKVLEAPEGETLLQVMLDAGLDIPHYCYHPKLSIDGSCRLCQVTHRGRAEDADLLQYKSPRWDGRVYRRT